MTDYPDGSPKNNPIQLIHNNQNIHIFQVLYRAAILGKKPRVSQLRISFLILSQKLFLLTSVRIVAGFENN